MNNFNVLRSNSKGFGANLTDFYSGQIKTLDRLVNSKDSVSTNLNLDDINLGTTDSTNNSIVRKQSAGDYKYDYHYNPSNYTNKPKPQNAVKQIDTINTHSDISHYKQKLTYTSFNSVKTIIDTIDIGAGTTSSRQAEIKEIFYYGSNGQRVLMISKRNDTLVSKKYYIGEYELTQNVEVPSLKEVTYISSPTGLVAAEVKIDTVPTLYYILTDHLGSITQLLTAQGSAVGNARFTYDAWGRLRDVRSPNPYMIGNAQTTAFHILDRGYCGHEHLLDHGIINMNGRIYDPVVGQFMQADNYIQTPEDYIGYNRYSYCRHNPFKYTDPSGEQYQAGSGGGGVMAAVGAAIQAAEEQAQNAMAMALGAAMQNWNPRTRIGEADAARARAERSFGGASGGSASDGGFFGKAIKAVGSFFSGLFKKSDPKGDTETSSSQQQETGTDGAGKAPAQDTEYDGKKEIEIGPETRGKVAYGVFVWDQTVYNCHSYAWHDCGWDPTDPSNALSFGTWPSYDGNPMDDAREMADELETDEAVQVGDRIIYFDVDGNAKHSAIVSEVNEFGQATRCTSKWGTGPLYDHHPRGVPESYGTVRRYYRMKNQGY